MMPRAQRAAGSFAFGAITTLAMILGVSPASEAQVSTVIKLSRQAMLAIAPVARRGQTVAESDVARWAASAVKPGGSKAVGQELAARRLGREALEDTYLRIAIHQNRIERAEAESMFARLSGTPGFQETLRKVTGANDRMTIGHRSELQIALAARQQGIRVNAIGLRFDDGIKKGTTDLDLVLGNGRRTVVVEAKNYGEKEPIPLDQFRADMLTLNAYAKANPQERVVPVFTVTHVPSDRDSWRLLQIAARQHSVELVAGTPAEQAIQIRQLLEVLQ